jgi:hypothetical protein
MQDKTHSETAVVADVQQVFALPPKRTTEGAVVMSSRLYSRSSRSCTISECSNPRNPHRKPKPMADDTCKAWMVFASAWLPAKLSRRCSHTRRFLAMHV